MVWLSLSISLIALLALLIRDSSEELGEKLKIEQKLVIFHFMVKLVIFHSMVHKAQEGELSFPTRGSRPPRCWWCSRQSTLPESSLCRVLKRREVEP